VAITREELEGEEEEEKARRRCKMC